MPEISRFCSALLPRLPVIPCVQNRIFRALLGARMGVSGPGPTLSEFPTVRRLRTT